MLAILSSITVVGYLFIDINITFARMDKFIENSNHLFIIIYLECILILAQTDYFTSTTNTEFYKLELLVITLLSGALLTYTTNEFYFSLFSSSIDFELLLLIYLVYLTFSLTNKPLVVYLSNLLSYLTISYS
jgi:hypothetical protein